MRVNVEGSHGCALTVGYVASNKAAEDSRTPPKAFGAGAFSHTPFSPRGLGVRLSSAAFLRYYPNCPTHLITPGSQKNLASRIGLPQHLSGDESKDNHYSEESCVGSTR